MPELPEVEALAHHLREHAVGQLVSRVDVAAIPVLKTVQPAVSVLHERRVTGAGRHGKFLSLYTDGPALVMHLARAGWLRWSDSLVPAAPRPGKGPIAMRVHLSGGTGFDLTEAGTQKRLAVYVVADAAGVAQLPGIRRLGPDALALSREQLGEVLRDRTERLKTVLTDQTVIAGVKVA
jgi:formamidopyrimidine-DNA glycosylase